MRRRLFTITSAISLTLFVATLIIGLRSTGTLDQFSWDSHGASRVLCSRSGEIVLCLFPTELPMQFQRGYATRPVYFTRPSFYPTGGVPGLWTARGVQITTSEQPDAEPFRVDYRVFVLEYWLAATATGLLPLCWLGIGFWQRRHAHRPLAGKQGEAKSEPAEAEQNGPPDRPADAKCTANQPCATTELSASAAPVTVTSGSKYRAGQVWVYKTRPGEEASRITIAKVEPYGKGAVIHVHISDVAIKNPAAINGTSTFVSHMPFAEEALDKSLVQLITTTNELPSFEEGYRLWKEQADQGRAGVFTLTVAEALSHIESAFQQNAATTTKASSKLDEQITRASTDRAAVPEVCRMLMAGHVFIIATWSDPQSKQITIQDFIKDGRSFLPLFADEAHFRAETSGSEFEKKGVSIDCNFFVSLLRGDEQLILNPGSTTPVLLRRADFEPFLKPVNTGG